MRMWCPFWKVLLVGQRVISYWYTLPALDQLALPVTVAIGDADDVVRQVLDVAIGIDIGQRHDEIGIGCAGRGVKSRLDRAGHLDVFLEHG